VSETRFRTLADHVPALIAELDGRGRFTFASAAYRDLLGHDPAKLIGTTPETLVHSDELPDARTEMARALAERGRVRGLHRVRHADGSWRWFETAGRAYLTAGGEVRLVSVGRDVTEARRAEAERARLEAQMQEVQRLESLGVLAGGIAHDFNNLLAVILGNAALLEGDAGGENERRERLRRIRAAGRHAEALTDQMLAYAGKSLGERVPLDLSGLVRETADLLRASVSRKCRLDLDLRDDLPGVRGDPTQLRQVLLNLVSNASETFGARGGRLQVRTRASEADAAALADGFGSAERPPGVWVALEVEDDGPGIAAELRGRIFEPFFSTRGAGRGLGLAAVLGIASAHGGVVQVESEPGRGTTFRVLLPPCEALPATVAGSAPAERRAPPPGLVLVVDDDEGVAEVAQGLLEQAGFRAERALGGRAALARVRAGGVDAVVLDLVMPDLSGAEVLRVLSAERPELPVVLTSGDKRELASERLGGAGAFAFVQKPFDPVPLCAALCDALEKRAAAARPS
jgi:PAS domain S-box-containing protein